MWRKRASVFLIVSLALAARAAAAEDVDPERVRVGITVTCMDGLGKALKGFRVALETPDGTTVADEECGKDGTLRFEGLRPGRYEVELHFSPRLVVRGETIEKKGKQSELRPFILNIGPDGSLDRNFFLANRTDRKKPTASKNIAEISLDRPDRSVLPPTLEEVRFRQSGRAVPNGARIKDGKLTVELAGTPNVQGFVEHPGGLEELADSGDGRYLARLQVPEGTGDYAIRTWLRDPRGTPETDSRRQDYGFRYPPPPPPPTFAEKQRWAASEVGPDRVYFQHDRAEIQPRFAGVLDRWAEVAGRYADLRFRVVGACNEIGSDDYNFRLGKLRASAVRAALIERGVDGARLVITSVGRSRARDCEAAEPGAPESCLERDRYSAIEPFAGRPGP